MRAGLEVIRAYNGQEAIDKCHEADMILMDIRMPNVDGYEATREIRKKCIEIPIIGQSANAMSGDKEKALKVGCNEYLTKPINIVELISVIKRFATHNV